MFEDRRKYNGIETRNKNTKIVKDWVEANPNGTVKECSKATGISKQTIYNIAKAEKTSEARNEK